MKVLKRTLKSLENLGNNSWVEMELNKTNNILRTKLDESFLSLLHTKKGKITFKNGQKYLILDPGDVF